MCPVGHGEPWEDFEQQKYMDRCEFQVTGRGGRWDTGVDQMQGYRKGALDMCPGRTRCGLEPGRDKETGVGQRGINKGINRQESVAA